MSPCLCWVGALDGLGLPFPPPAPQPRAGRDSGGPPGGLGLLLRRLFLIPGSSFSLAKWGTIEASKGVGGCWSEESREQRSSTRYNTNHHNPQTAFQGPERKAWGRRERNRKLKNTRVVPALKGTSKAEPRTATSNYCDSSW